MDKREYTKPIATSRPDITALPDDGVDISWEEYKPTLNSTKKLEDNVRLRTPRPRLVIEADLDSLCRSRTELRQRKVQYARRIDELRLEIYTYQTHRSESMVTYGEKLIPKSFVDLYAEVDDLKSLIGHINKKERILNDEIWNLDQELNK